MEATRDPTPPRWRPGSPVQRLNTHARDPRGRGRPHDCRKKTYGSPPGQVLAPEVGAFGEMSSDMYGLADVISAAMTEDHLQFLEGSAKEICGMFRQRVLRDWGHAAHLGWARLLHDRRRDLIER